MKIIGKQFLVIIALIGTLAFSSTAAEQVSPLKNASQVPDLVSGTLMTREYVQMVGRMAYLWGWPLVNAHNRRASMAQIPEPGLNGGIMPVAPIGHFAMLTDYIKPDQTFITCTNQDVVYGGGCLALDKGPVVVQVPDFGSRFWVYALYDARTDAFGHVGKPYGTKPGFYLVVGPNWKGKKPAGMKGVLHSPTELANVIPRVFKDDTPEDSKAVQPVLNQIMAYPLSEFDGKMKTTDWSRIPHFPMPPVKDRSEVRWVVPEAYADQLPTVMKLVPPLPGEEALYRWIGSVFEAAAKDPETKKALVESFIDAERELLSPLIQFRLNGRPAGNGWNSPVDNAQWGTDYLNRTAVAKSNIYENRPEETKYIFTELDSQGQPLNGENLYIITFPKGQLPPVKGFWSLTLYTEQHFFNPNALNRYSLGTKSKTLRFNPDGSLTLYAGSASPGTDRESNWLPAPKGAFALYIRAYWPEKAILDGTWIPPRVEQVK
jgi:hypothetical protein